MSTEEKKRKRKAAVIAVLFHVLITVLFLFFGLKQPVPLPEQQGASIEFGWDDTGSMADLQAPQPVAAPVQEAKPETAPEVQEEVATEDDSEVAVPAAEEEKPKPVKKPDPKPEPKPTEKPKPDPKPEPAEEKPQISDELKKAMESFGKPGEGTKGETGGEGSQGDPQGTEGQGALGGGAGAWQLDGRSMLPGYGTKISDTKEEGIVVLNITVDKSGKVTGATPNLRESTTTSQYLINMAINDVKSNFRFNADPNAAFEQRGKVKYVFRLQ
ncbi:MAG: hypothetical protein ABR572_00035 [Cryomorphaceae bacterium]|nr:hypothetical protein [Flavobacteriales bacterium]